MPFYSSPSRRLLCSPINRLRIISLRPVCVSPASIARIMAMTRTTLRGQGVAEAFDSKFVNWFASFPVGALFQGQLSILLWPHGCKSGWCLCRHAPGAIAPHADRRHG